MLHTLDPFCVWLQSTQLSLFVSSLSWLIPALQVLHILCVALVISSVFILDLRLVGLTGGTQPEDQMARRFLPFIWWPLPVLLVTGALLISAEPARSLENPSFALKMLLLLTAIAITVLARRQIGMQARPGAVPRRFRRRLTGAAGLLLWIGVVFAGRWIAYTQP
jgi:hypothetical protein